MNTNKSAITETTERQPEAEERFSVIPPTQARHPAPEPGNPRRENTASARSERLHEAYHWWVFSGR